MKGPPDDGWRTEADEEWLRHHRSDNFARLRKRLRALGRFSDAVSHAELGPFGGAPRKPQLKIEGAKYSTVRYTAHRIAYTTVHVYLQRCRRCGAEVEAHRLIYIAENGYRKVVGALQACRMCQANSWMFYSRMPAVVRARAWARKVVL